MLISWPKIYEIIKLITSTIIGKFAPHIQTRLNLRAEILDWMTPQNPHLRRFCTHPRFLAPAVIVLTVSPDRLPLKEQLFPSSVSRTPLSAGSRGMSLPPLGADLPLHRHPDTYSRIKRKRVIMMMIMMMTR